MKLTTDWGRLLRGTAVVAILVCAISWTVEVANASSLPLPLTPGTSISSAALGYAPAAAPSETNLSEANGLQLTASPYTSEPSTDTTLTAMVEEGDTHNPYVNGTAGTNPAALTFVFMLSNTNGSNGVGMLSIDGFTGWGVYYGSWVGTGTGAILPVPHVSMPLGSPSVIDVPYAASSFKSGTSAEVVLYTNATNYGTVLDPVTWGGSAIYSAAAYMPAAATPEPSSLLLAVLGMMFFLGLGWRRRKS
ncbi:MAG TPA: PEP-CTERM sorting domain-containing protein [Pirellulales bacterium]|jgi:hypothetical protein|nr:PEP-CTERM sorting domain-containing protein [Pirellulales bacterium]